MFGWIEIAVLLCNVLYDYTGPETAPLLLIQSSRASAYLLHMGLLITALFPLATSLLLPLSISAGELDGMLAR